MSIETRRTRHSIVIYAMNFAPELTGVGRYTGELALYLANSGWSVDVVTTPPHYPAWAVPFGYRAWNYSVEQSDALRVTRCPIFLSRRVTGIWRLLASFSFMISSLPVAMWRIWSSAPDVVLTVEPTLLVAPIALIAAKVRGSRTVLHVQDLEIDAAFGVGHLNSVWVQRLATWFEKRLLSFFDSVIAISNDMRERLIRKGVSARNLSVIRNWVDIEKIFPTQGANSFRELLRLGPNTFVALYAGSLGAKQSLETIIEAAKVLAESSNIKIVIAGEGPQKTRIAEAGLPNVELLPLQPEDKLCELLNLADLHLLPQSDGAANFVLPSKLGGMLATGRPILVAASQESEIATFLDGAAHIVPMGDSGAFADVIRKCSMQPRSAPMPSRNLLAQLDSRVTLPQFADLLFSRSQK